MRPPCEYVVRYYLPQVRARVIKRLVEEAGLRLAEVARILSLSPSAVSKYRRILEEEAELDPEYLDRVAEEIISALERGEGACRVVEVLCGYCLTSRLGGALCRLHREEADLPPDCRACFRLSSRGEEEALERARVLESLRRGLRTLESSPEFPRLVPEVRTNLIMAVRDAKSIYDVAGFPGRITVIRGRVRALAEPEFGASRFMASLLLEAMKKSGEARAMLCIKYDELVESVLRRAGLGVAYFRGRMRREEYVREFSSALSRSEAIPEVLVDLGEVGIEPVAYLLGSDAAAVAERGAEIARGYCELRERLRSGENPAVS